MMDKKEFEIMDENFKGAIQHIRDCLNSEDFNAHTAMMGARLVNASKNGKGRVSLEFDAPRIVVEVSGNEGALIIAMQQLIEHFGVKKNSWSNCCKLFYFAKNSLDFAQGI
jgi:hypothetical protein